MDSVLSADRAVTFFDYYIHDRRLWLEFGLFKDLLLDKEIEAFHTHLFHCLRAMLIILTLRP